MILKTAVKGSRLKDAIIKEFEQLCKENVILYKLLYETSAKTNIFFIGGFLRSIINKRASRDIDIIVNLDEDQLTELIRTLNLPNIKNKLGGYKIDLSTVKVDIWSIYNNWAFKSKLISNYNSNEMINKIAEGTFFNYDSLVLDLRTEQSNFKYYNECVNNNCLDIIRKSSKYRYGNPGKLNNVLRAFHIRKKTGLDFSSALCDFIRKNITNIGLVKLEDITQHLELEATKQERFKEIATSEAIKESLIYVNTKLNDYHQQGSQLFLF